MAPIRPASPALFLDRDGVINVDHGYVHEIDKFEFMPGIFDLARFACVDLGWPVVVISNQAGIGRGYYDEAAYARLTDWMRARFASEGAPLAAAYHCPYHPVHGVGPYKADNPWRKPRPGMILAAAADLGLDLPGSALVGDMPTDIEAGHAAGVGLLVKVNSTAGAAAARAPQPASIAYHEAGDLAGALVLLRANCIPAGPIPSI